MLVEDNSLFKFRKEETDCFMVEYVHNDVEVGVCDGDCFESPEAVRLMEYQATIALYRNDKMAQNSQSNKIDVVIMVIQCPVVFMLRKALIRSNDDMLCC